MDLSFIIDLVLIAVTIAFLILLVVNIKSSKKIIKLNLLLQDKYEETRVSWQKSHESQEKAIAIWQEVALRGENRREAEGLLEAEQGLSSVSETSEEPG